MCQTTTATVSRTFTVSSRRGTRTVVVDRTDREAAEILRPSSASFAADLVRQFDRSGRLSACQLAWMHVLADEAEAEKRPVVVAAPEAEAVGTDDDMANIVAMFQKAGAALKFPKVRLQDARCVGYRLTMAGERSKYPGTVNVAAANGEWLGRIMEDGIFFPSRSAQHYPGLLPLLNAFAHDPASVAKSYGGLTGNCCFCNLGLTDPRSVAAGYGPVCAAHYSLQW